MKSKKLMANQDARSATNLQQVPLPFRSSSPVLDIDMDKTVVAKSITNINPEN